MYICFHNQKYNFKVVYSSIVFLLYFLPLFLLLYYLFPRLWQKNTLLFSSSILFYFWGAGHLVLLLLTIGFLTWLLGWLIVKTQYKGFFLFVSLIVFIGILLWFKYMGFIFENLNSLGFSVINTWEGVKSLGVSFFTFQAISYCIDVYKKRERFEKNPVNVVFYITMFPQLLSGPLVRYHTIESQIKSRDFNFVMFSSGIKRFVIGLGKKVLIADTLSPLVAQIIDNDAISISPSVAWLAILAFAVQIFFDFSGYTDMAIGVGKMLGFKLPENFNYPYISKSITEFWRRWHMSFTLWIKEYIFNPLAIELRYWGKIGISVSLFLTFFICGFWHGPSWNFILWGSSQGFFLVIEELFLLKSLKRAGFFSRIYVILVILTCLVFFRTTDLHHAFHFFSFLFALPQTDTLGLEAFLTLKHTLVLLIGIVFSMPLRIPEKWQGEAHVRIWQILELIAICIILILSVMQMMSQTYLPFIYFQF